MARISAPKMAPQPQVSVPKPQMAKVATPKTVQPLQAKAPAAPKVPAAMGAGVPKAPKPKAAPNFKNSNRQMYEQDLPKPVKQSSGTGLSNT